MHRTLTEHPKEFQRALRVWFLANRRPLPWRTLRSLYRTVVSEFMLQQTQVRTALPYFERWTRELPDFGALADASDAKVSKLWEGLGYYSRARNLHRLAKILIEMPSLPLTAEEWEELPGVGPYTAAAISSIACGQKAACVDGNIVRVLARLTADTTTFGDNGSAVKHFTPIARSVLNRRHPGEHNEAMMELGATICTKSAPECERCPVSGFCAGLVGGNPERLPRIARRATERHVVTRVWCMRRGKLLLHRATAASRRLAGLHELPDLIAAGVAAGIAAKAQVLARRKRSITHHRIAETIMRIAPVDVSQPQAANGLVWVPLRELNSVSLSGPHRRWVREIIAEGGAT